MRFKSQKTVVYIVKFSNKNECFYKIGITDRFTSRLSPIKKLYNNFEIIISKVFDVKTAIEKEKLLHIINKEYEYIPKIKFGGYLECFSDINKNECYEILSSR